MRLQAYLLLLLAFALVASGCNLNSDDNNDDNGEEPIVATSTPSGKPTVTISSPQSGSEFVVNDPLFVETTVTDTVGVSYVQLRSNGASVRTIGIEDGNNTFAEPILDYTPRVAGEVTLEVVAVREDGTESDPAQVEVSIRDSAVEVTATAPAGDRGPVINPNDPNCRALINTNLNFRTGPSVNFTPPIRVLGAGEVFQAVGRLADNSWWQLVDRNGTRGWVSFGSSANPFITLYDGTSVACRNIPVVAPPASPTPNATNTIQPSNTPVPPQTPVPTTAPTNTAVPLPNLVISSVFNDDTITIPDGESEVTAEFSINVTNNGGAVDTQFSVEARVVGGDTFDVGTFGNLGANQTLSQTVDITFTDTGSATVIFEVDVDDTIEESNENDNVRIVEVTVE